MLANAQFEATLPVVDLERAKEFYEKILGLRPIEEPASDVVRFAGGEDTSFVLYERQTPTTADHTVGSFAVENLEEVVAGLSERDVVISPIFMSKKEALKRLKEFDAFLLGIVSEGKVLYGDAKWLGM